MTDAARPTSWLRALPRLGPMLALLLLVAVVSILSPDFRKPENFFNIANQMSFVGVVAIGMTWVMLLGGIDLSVGSMVALAGGNGIFVMNALSEQGVAPAWCVAAAGGVMILGGIVLGLINGGVIVLGRVTPFIVTLGTMAAYRAIILYQAQGSEVRSLVPSFADLGSGGFTLPLLHSSRGRPILVAWPTVALVVSALAGEFMLRGTVFGRHVLAVGGNRTAARYAGVPVARVTVIVYTLAGLACGLAALLNASRLNSIASSTTGQLYELDAIAAVVIGGTAMNGGRGSVLGTVLGVLLLGVIGNMLTMLGVENYIQGLVKGCIIIGAVLVQRGQGRVET